MNVLKKITNSFNELNTKRKLKKILYYYNLGMSNEACDAASKGDIRTVKQFLAAPRVKERLLEDDKNRQYGLSDGELLLICAANTQIATLLLNEGIAPSKRAADMTADDGNEAVANLIRQRLSSGPKSNGPQPG